MKALAMGIQNHFCWLSKDTFKFHFLKLFRTSFFLNFNLKKFITFFGLQSHYSVCSRTLNYSALTSKSRVPTQVWTNTCCRNKVVNHVGRHSFETQQAVVAEDPIKSKVTVAHNYREKVKRWGSSPWLIDPYMTQPANIKRLI